MSSIVTVFLSLGVSNSLVHFLLEGYDVVSYT